MSKRLSEEEKKRRRSKRDEKARFKDAHPELDKRCYEILRILRDAPEHSEIKYNAAYFEKFLDTSIASVNRSIYILKKNHLLEEKQVNGSYVINKNFDDKFYSEETKKNVALVASLGGLLAQFKNTPLYESVKKLIYFLQPEVAKVDKVFSSGRIIVPPQMDYDINIKNWTKVYTAIQENRKIQFRYVKPNKNSKALRIVQPYQLILDNGSVYLSGYSDYADTVVLYDLNFMDEIIVTREKFSLPDDYDFKNYCAGGRLGAFKTSDVKTFKIRFTNYAKEWIKYHKWADDQKIIREDEDSTTISFTSAQEEKVFEEIMKWGSQAQPLAPKSLVKNWKNEIETLYEMTKE